MFRVEGFGFWVLGLRVWARAFFQVDWPVLQAIRMHVWRPPQLASGVQGVEVVRLGLAFGFRVWV